MATITKWKNANGTMSYRALIRVKREGKIIASESRTFPRRAMAENWSRKRETEIKGEGSTRKLALKDITVGDVIHGRVPGRGVRVATVPRGNLRFLDDLRQPKEGHDDRRQDGAARAA